MSNPWFGPKKFGFGGLPISREHSIHTGDIVLNEARSEFSALYLVLHSDVQICRKNLSETYTGFWDRVYTKTVFSMIEGVSFRVRQYIVSASDEGYFSVDTPTLNFLSESTYKLDAKGKIKEKEECLIFLPSFRLTFTVFGKCLGIEKQVTQAFSHSGFSDFQKSVEIRNRLTHPKQTSEMIISGSEIEILKKSEDWFHSLVLPLIQCAFASEIRD